MIEVQEMNSARQEGPIDPLSQIQTYYSGQEIERLFTHHSYASFMDEAGLLTRYTSSIKAVNPEDIKQWYWGKHNDSYLSRLNICDMQISSLPDTYRQADTIVVIPARNERETSRAIQALAHSYGEGFTKDVPILIYHNFVSYPASDVIEDLAMCSNWENVAVIHEQVPRGSTIADASKVAFDIAYRFSENPMATVIRTDADVQKIGDRAIQVAHSYLQTPSIFGVSTIHTLDSEELRELFPVYAFVSRLEHLIEKNITKKTPGQQITFMYGFGAMQLRTYGGVGGQKVARFDSEGNLRNVPYADMQMFADLKHLSGAYKHKIMPVFVENLLGCGISIEVSASREIAAMLAGDTATSRWNNTQKAYSERSKPRIKVQELPRFNHIPELSDPTPANFVKAFENFLSSRTLLYYYETPPELSCQLIELLMSCGCTIDCTVLDAYNSEQYISSLTPQDFSSVWDSSFRLVRVKSIQA